MLHSGLSSSDPCHCTVTPEWTDNRCPVESKTTFIHTFQEPNVLVSFIQSRVRLIHHSGYVCVVSWLHGVWPIPSLVRVNIVMLSSNPSRFKEGELLFSELPTPAGPLPLEWTSHLVRPTELIAGSPQPAFFCLFPYIKPCNNYCSRC